MRLTFLRIDSDIRQGYAMSLWLFSGYMDGAIVEVKMEIGRMGVRFSKGEREWKSLFLFYFDNLVLCCD